MKETVISLFTALRFLTILPVPWYASHDSEYYQESVKYFPVVGMLIGVGGYCIANLLSILIPHQITCCLMILYLSAISGFLHLDGLSDTADGLLSYRPRDKKLSIMRDSRSGAMGVIVLVFLLLLKFAALTAIPNSCLPMVLLFMPVAGRCSIVLTMGFLPYARSEGGLGQLFYLNKKYYLHLAPVAILLLLGVFWEYELTLIAILALVFSAIPFGIWCKKALGGATGDTLGAVCELTETLVAILFAAVLTQ